MVTYNIYLDRIEISFGSSVQDSAKLEAILTSLSIHSYNVYARMPVGKGIAYLRWSHLIDDLLKVIDFNKPVDEASVVGILRNSIPFTRRNFPNFQINIINHV